MTHPTSGRGAEAARNDGKILDAARDVFLADPNRPIAEVAHQAGVGISALYRRYPSKEALLRELATDGLTRFNNELEAALMSRADPWTVYCDCLQRVLEGRSQALAQRLAGTFTPTPELHELAATTGARYFELHDRTQRAGTLRPDVTPADVVLLLEMLSVIDTPGATNSNALRRRYLTLILQSLHASSTDPLPGPPASDKSLSARWRR